MRTHLPALSNLIRREKLGVESWVEEQENYWKKNITKFKEWIAFHRECKARKSATHNQ